MSERSIELAKQSIAGKSKYDYFIVGIAAATFAYFAKDFIPSPPLGFNQNSLVLSSLMLLILSIISGLKKIENHNQFLEKNGKYLDYSEYLAAYKKSAIEGTTAINSESGEILTSEESAIKADVLESLLPKLRAKLESQETRIGLYHSFRDYSLFLGYFFLGLSKFFPILTT